VEVEVEVEVEVVIRKKLLPSPKIPDESNISNPNTS